MTKENKGEVHFNKQKDWQYLVEVDYDWSYNCDAYGCDYICRCGTIENARVEEMSPYYASSLTIESFTGGSGTEGKFGQALAYRLFRHGLSDFQEMFEVNVCGGYYGEEIGSVELVDTVGLYNFQKEIERFNSSSNSERLRQVLSIEYGYLLPEVEQYKEWQLVQVAVEDVQASPDILKRTKKEIVESYQLLTPWYGPYSHRTAPDWFPGVVVVPKGEGYRLIDGFHRFKAWTTKPGHMDAKKWSRLRKKKKIMVIAPVV